MSKSTELVPATVISTGLQTGLDARTAKDDILVIASVQAEEYAEQQIAEAMKEAEEAGKEASKHVRTAMAAVEERGKEEWVQVQADLEAALKVAEPKAVVSFSISSSLDSPGYEDLDDDTPAGTPRKPVYKTFHTQLRGGLGSSNRNGTERCSGQFEFYRTVKLPKAAVTALKARDRALAEQEDANKRAIEWKKRQARIPFLEKKARAKLGVRELQKTEEGRAILDELVGNVTEEVLALPSR